MNPDTWRSATRCLVFAAGLFLAACAPGLPTFPALSPAQATASPVPLSTTTPVLASTLTPSPTETTASLPSFTPIPSFTSTSSPSAALTPSPTGAAPVTPAATSTATLVESISIDKLPPGTVYKRVRVDNATRSQMDISLHCTTAQGLHTILEYENVKHLTIEAPEGDYIYVVYVGGRQIVGSFSLRHEPGVVLTVYSDHVTVR